MRRFIIVLDVLDDSYPGDVGDVALWADIALGDTELAPPIDVTVYDSVEALADDYTSRTGPFSPDPLRAPGTDH